MLSILYVEILLRRVITMELFDSLKSKIQGKNLKIVFPEALDERILGAARSFIS